MPNRDFQFVDLKLSSKEVQRVKQIKDTYWEHFEEKNEFDWTRIWTGDLWFCVPVLLPSELASPYMVVFLSLCRLGRVPVCWSIQPLTAVFQGITPPFSFRRTQALPIHLISVINFMYKFQDNVKTQIWNLKPSSLRRPSCQYFLFAVAVVTAVVRVVPWLDWISSALQAGWTSLLADSLVPRAKHPDKYCEVREPYGRLP